MRAHQEGAAVLGAVSTDVDGSVVEDSRAVFGSGHDRDEDRRQSYDGGRDVGRDHPVVDLRDVDVRRSRRRTRTVSAYRDGDRTVVLIPARFSSVEEREWVERMVTRLEAADRRRNPLDGDLLDRARELSRRHLDGLARPQSVTWVDNQHHRWGSCTPADASIRLSSRLQGMPSWVLDYVLLHELAHLLVPTHSRQFWGLLESYPRTERARGFLAGIDHATGHEGPGHHDRDDDTDLDDTNLDDTDLDGTGVDADSGEGDVLPTTG